MNFKNSHCTISKKFLLILGCFENLYYKKYPKIKKANQDLSTHLKLSFSEFNKELNKIVKEYKEEFLYLKYTLLKNLRLPYDTNFFRQYDDALELTQEDIQNIIQEEKKYYEDKYNETEINGFWKAKNRTRKTFLFYFFIHFFYRLILKNIFFQVINRKEIQFTQLLR